MAEELPLATASLRIFGRPLDKQQISSVIRVSPSKFYRNGEVTQSGASLQHDLWCLDSPLPRSEPLETHLQWLNTKLRESSGTLSTVVGMRSTRVDVFGAISVGGDSCYLEFSQSSLMFLAELGIGIELSIVFIEVTEKQKTTPAAAKSSPTVYARAELRPKRGTTVGQVIVIGDPTDISLLAAALKVSASEGSDGAQPWAVELPQTDDVNLQITHLRELLRSGGTLETKHDGRFDIVCRFTADCEWPSIWLSPETIAALAENALSFSCELNLYHAPGSIKGELTP